MVDLTIKTSRPCSGPEMDAVLKEAALNPNSDLYGILGYYTDLPVVSTDFLHDKRSSTLHKIIAWYDNECGYSNRLVDLVVYAEYSRS